MQITLAIDYGLARVGTAVSAGWMARPLEVYSHGTLASLLRRLLQLADQEMVTQFLVGLPVNADGSENEQSSYVRLFAQQLANRSAIPVFLWDEYGSSQKAQAQMIGANTRRKARRQKLDAIAAAVFLQEYIESEDKEAERLLPKEE